MLRLPTGSGKISQSIAIAHDVESPHTHIIAHLLETLEQNRIPVPGDMKSSADLTEYAVQTKYPRLYEPVTEEDYREALTVAECVHAWVRKQLV